MRVDTKYTKFFHALSEKTKSAIPLCLTLITLSNFFFGISQAKLKIKGCQEYKQKTNNHIKLFYLKKKQLEKTVNTRKMRRI